VIDLNKKGQGALEYLMTYGWALLVIVVVGAALFALGVLNPSTYTQKSCRGFNFFQYQDQRLATDVFTIQILNGAQPATITNISVLGDTTAGGASLPGLSVLNENNQAVSVISQGQKVTVSAGSRALGNATLKNAGDPYTYTIKIDYNVVGGIAGNTDQATCSGRVQ
jgi:hypothetical protein